MLEAPRYLGRLAICSVLERRVGRPRGGRVGMQKASRDRPHIDPSSRERRGGKVPEMVEVEVPEAERRTVPLN